ncbi:hypothetical protein AVEN_86955-1 [Araneus ventricosus]|uniref:Pre-C2HC domain-containing protein n=1 Tax=Araneus ventricosus TaxID=182803 RepID=A0A4Y2NBI4_ARAVE|nr:hypothetical protein AVEN_50985-1 [Araneus ventricosus]GBN36064.1 hypothetical protein AVEN_86955-1 [Araneus ventricosus]
MSEEGRSRSTLSDIYSSPTAFGNQFCSPLRNPYLTKDDSSRNYTEAWVINNHQQSRTKAQICQEISRRETLIDKNQDYAQKWCNQISCGNEALIASRNNKLLTFEKKIEECEGVLISIGPCPIMNEYYSRHHESTKDVEMAETGQYVGSVPYTSSDFKIVSPKNSTKIRPVESKSPIETSNKYQNSMGLEEQDKENSPSKISIPTINLKINDDYNLTLQEINRNFPITEDKYDRVYIRILPYSLSLDDRTKIIEFLNKNELLSESVLSETPENRPFKIVIKGLPPDQNKEIIFPRTREK